MSDFLLRLSARLLSEPLAEAVPTLEPRSAGRFEPLAEGRGDGGDELAVVETSVPAANTGATRTIELAPLRVEQVRREPADIPGEPSPIVERHEHVVVPALAAPRAPQTPSAPASRVLAPLAPRPEPALPPPSIPQPPPPLPGEPKMRHEVAPVPVMTQTSAAPSAPPRRVAAPEVTAPALSPAVSRRPLPVEYAPPRAHEPPPRVPLPPVAPAPALSAPPSVARALEPAPEKPAASTAPAPLVPPPLIERVTERVLERVSIEAPPAAAAQGEESSAVLVVADRGRESKTARVAAMRPAPERETRREEAVPVEADASKRESPARLVSSAPSLRAAADREPALSPRALSPRALSPSPAPERQPPPEIHIEIGRIVVQANTAQRAPEPRRLKLQEPRLDLSAYLARRDRSSR